MLPRSMFHDFVKLSYFIITYTRPSDKKIGLQDFLGSYSRCKSNVVLGTATKLLGESITIFKLNSSLPYKKYEC